MGHTFPISNDLFMYPFVSVTLAKNTETPDELRRRADEMEAAEQAENAENSEMIDKLTRRGFTVTLTDPIKSNTVVYLTSRVQQSPTINHVQQGNALRTA